MGDCITLCSCITGLAATYKRMVGSVDLQASSEAAAAASGVEVEVLVVSVQHCLAYLQSGLDERLLREASNVYSKKAVQFAHAHFTTHILIAFSLHCLEYSSLQSCARFSIPICCTVFDDTPPLVM